MNSLRDTANGHTYQTAHKTEVALDDQTPVSRHLVHALVVHKSQIVVRVGETCSSTSAVAFAYGMAIRNARMEADARELDQVDQSATALKGVQRTCVSTNRTCSRH